MVHFADWYWAKTMSHAERTVTVKTAIKMLRLGNQVVSWGRNDSWCIFVGCHNQPLRWLWQLGFPTIEQTKMIKRTRKVHQNDTVNRKLRHLASVFFPTNDNKCMLNPAINPMIPTSSPPVHHPTWHIARPTLHMMPATRPTAPIMATSMATSRHRCWSKTVNTFPELRAIPVVFVYKLWLANLW